MTPFILLSLLLLPLLARCQDDPAASAQSVIPRNSNIDKDNSPPQDQMKNDDGSSRSISKNSSLENDAVDKAFKHMAEVCFEKVDCNACADSFHPAEATIRTSIFDRMFANTSFAGAVDDSLDQMSSLLTDEIREACQMMLKARDQTNQPPQQKQPEMKKDEHQVLHANWTGTSGGQGVFLATLYTVTDNAEALLSRLLSTSASVVPSALIHSGPMMASNNINGNVGGMPSNFGGYPTGRPMGDAMDWKSYIPQKFEKFVQGGPSPTASMKKVDVVMARRLTPATEPKSPYMGSYFSGYAAIPNHIGSYTQDLPIVGSALTTGSPLAIGGEMDFGYAAKNPMADSPPTIAKPNNFLSKNIPSVFNDSYQKMKGVAKDFMSGGSRTGGIGTSDKSEIPSKVTSNDGNKISDVFMAADEGTTSLSADVTGVDVVDVKEHIKDEEKNFGSWFQKKLAEIKKELTDKYYSYFSTVNKSATDKMNDLKRSSSEALDKLKARKEDIAEAMKELQRKVSKSASDTASDAESLKQKADGDLHSIEHRVEDDANDAIKTIKDRSDALEKEAASKFYPDGQSDTLDNNRPATPPRAVVLHLPSGKKAVAQPVSLYIEEKDGKISKLIEIPPVAPSEESRRTSTSPSYGSSVWHALTGFWKTFAQGGCEDLPAYVSALGDGAIFDAAALSRVLKEGFFKPHTQGSSSVAHTILSNPDWRPLMADEGRYAAVEDITMASKGAPRRNLHPASDSTDGQQGGGSSNGWMPTGGLEKLMSEGQKLSNEQSGGAIKSKSQQNGAGLFGRSPSASKSGEVAPDDMTAKNSGPAAASELASILLNSKVMSAAVASCTIVRARGVLAAMVPSVHEVFYDPRGGLGLATVSFLERFGKADSASNRRGDRSSLRVTPRRLLLDSADVSDLKSAGVAPTESDTLSKSTESPLAVAQRQYDQSIDKLKEAVEKALESAAEGAHQLGQSIVEKEKEQSAMSATSVTASPLYMAADGDVTSNGAVMKHAEFQRMVKELFPSSGGTAEDKKEAKEKVVNMIEKEWNKAIKAAEEKANEVVNKMQKQKDGTTGENDKDDTDLNAVQMSRREDKVGDSRESKDDDNSRIKKSNATPYYDAMPSQRNIISFFKMNQDGDKIQGMANFPAFPNVDSGLMAKLESNVVGVSSLALRNGPTSFSNAAIVIYSVVGVIFLAAWIWSLIQKSMKSSEIISALNMSTVGVHGDLIAPSTEIGSAGSSGSVIHAQYYRMQDDY